MKAFCFHFSFSSLYTMTQLRMGSNGIFGLDLVPSNATEVILTSCEVDALAVSQETRRPVIALPRELSTLPQEVNNGKQTCCLLLFLWISVSMSKKYGEMNMFKNVYIYYIKGCLFVIMGVHAFVSLTQLFVKTAE